MTFPDDNEDSSAGSLSPLPVRSLARTLIPGRAAMTCMALLSATPPLSQRLRNQGNCQIAVTVAIARLASRVDRPNRRQATS